MSMRLLAGWLVCTHTLIHTIALGVHNLGDPNLRDLDAAGQTRTSTGVSISSL
jgi:hypothetical protein